MCVAYFISSITIFAWYRLVHAVLLPQVPSLAQWEPAKTIPLATTGVLVVIAVLPEVPVIRDWIGQLRLIARALALYPYAFLRMSRLLSGNFNPKDDPERAVERELARYGASIDALHRQFSPSVCRGLSGIQMLRDEVSEQLTAMSGRTQRQFARVRRFLVARGEDFDIAERNYQRLMRRAAQICALDGAVVTREDEPYPLADFAVHAVERLLSRYRRLISQAALSCFGGGRGRREFIRELRV